MLLPVTHRALGALVLSPQLHLGWRREGCLHVCKTWALCHTPLTFLGKGGGTARHTGTVSFLAPLKMPQRTVSSRGMRDVTSRHVAAPAEGACGKGNVAQHGPGAHATQLPRSLSKSRHSRVPCARPFSPTGSSQPRQPLLHRADPRGCLSA